MRFHPRVSTLVLLVAPAASLLAASCRSASDREITLTFTVLDRVVEHGPVAFSIPIQSSGDAPGSGRGRTATVDEDTLTPDEFADFLGHAQGPGGATVLARPRMTLESGAAAAIIVGDPDDPPWFRIEVAAAHDPYGNVEFSLILDGLHPGDERTYHQERAGVIPAGRVLLLMMSNGRDLREIRFHLMAIEATTGDAAEGADR